MPASGDRWAALLGSPAGHSLSPVLHRAGYDALGRPWASRWRYDARECGAADLAAVLANARDDPSWAGFSLTMPLKEIALPLLDEVDASAVAVGAVNTVLPDAGRLLGANTDPAGVRAALTDLQAGPGPAAILGAGGTARAVVATLRAAGREVTVFARRPRGALLGAPVLAWETFVPADWSLVVATTPAGATDLLARRPWPPAAALLDVLYAPWPTRLAARAAGDGARVVGGMPVLVGQAVEQVRLMTGRRPDPIVLRAAGEAALAARSGADAGPRPGPAAPGPPVG